MSFLPQGVLQSDIKDHSCGIMGVAVHSFMNENLSKLHDSGRNALRAYSCFVLSCLADFITLSSLMYRLISSLKFFRQVTKLNLPLPKIKILDFSRFGPTNQWQRYLVSSHKRCYVLTFYIILLALHLIA